MGEGRGEAIDIPTTIENAEHLMKGVFDGYGQDFTTVKWGSPDYHKLASLERNVYQFSGAKNWQQLRELTDALREGDKVLSYREFRPKALNILDEYQGRWLETEYNAAIAGGQMASKWVDFEKHPDAHLEYRTMEDPRVRTEHVLLDKITRPVDDLFWKTYYPPNGWNCRCTVIRLNEGKKTADKDLQYPEIPKIFRVNLGQEGLAFPKGSAYYVGLPKDVPAKINNIIPDRQQPESVFDNGKGFVIRHPGKDNINDRELVQTIAIEIAKRGHSVEIMPELNDGDPARQTLVKDAKKGIKNADLRVDGKYVEIKQPENPPYSYNALSRNIGRARNQADHVIIDLIESVDKDLLYRAAKGRFKTHADLKLVEFRHKGKYMFFDRSIL